MLTDNGTSKWLQQYVPGIEIICYQPMQSLKLAKKNAMRGNKVLIYKNPVIDTIKIVP
jgi:hypothetical protein